MSYAKNGSVVNSNIQVIDFVTGELVEEVSLPDANNPLLFPRVGPRDSLVAAIQRDYITKDESIVIWDRESKELRNVYESSHSLYQVVWQDDKNLLFSVYSSSQPGIYRLNIETGKKELVYLGTVLDFDYDKKNNFIVISENTWNHEIFRWSQHPQQIKNISSSLIAEIQPYYFPGKKMLSYVSNRNGRFNLYLKNLETDTERRITNFTDEYIFEYQWFDNHSKVLVNISAENKVTAIEIDASTGGVLKNYNNRAYVAENTNGIDIYYLKKNNDGVRITNNKNIDFNIPKVKSLYRFQVVQDLLIYQEAVHRNLSIKSLSGKNVQLTDLGWVVYWYIKDSQLYYSYIVKRNSEQTALLNVAKLPIDKLSSPPEIIATNLETVYLRGSNSFSIDPESLDIYFSGGNQSDKPSIYLLEPNF